MQIAVIDDDPADRALLCRALRRKQDVNVQEFSAVAEVVDAISGTGSPPDIVLTDYGLAGENGVEAYDRLREASYSGPVVLITGAGNEQIAVTALKKGFADYITKSPESFSRLDQLVTHIVARAQAEAARQVAQQAQEEANRRLTEISESALVWFWELGPELRFSYVGGSTLDRFGLSLADSIGKAPWQIDSIRMPDGWEGLRRALKNHDPVRDAVWTIDDREGGPERIVEISGMAFFERNGFGGYRGIARDVTELRAVQSTLRKAEDRLRAAVESLTDVFILFDAQGRIVLHNHRLTEVLGFLKGFDEVIGLTVEDVLRAGLEARFYDPGDVGDDVEGWLAAQLDRHRGAPGVPWERRLADGRSLRIAVHATPEGGSVSVVSDVTAEREARGQLRQAQKMEAMGQLTGGVAHDFNNLLTVIMGNVALIRDRLAGRPDLREFAELALSASERGSSLTHQLLAFARKQPLNETALDLRMVVRDVVQMVDRTIGETYTTSVQAPAETVAVRLDSAQFQNAVLNLVFNARDAMPDGGEIRLDMGTLTLSAVRRGMPDDVPPGDYAVLRVADTGIGMSPDTIRQCCEPFFTTKEVGRGSGLGLSMVYGFVQQSGGALRIDSSEGRGTAISLHFPIWSGALPPGNAAAAAFVAEGSLAGRAVLLVEDDPDVRAVTRQMLEELGCEVAEVASGAAALDILEGGLRPEVLLTDFVLYGGMDGQVLAREALRRVPDMRVLYTSGYVGGFGADPAMGEAKGGFLGKPFTPEELHVKLWEILG